jgi:hypothetical protein
LGEGGGRRGLGVGRWEEGAWGREVGGGGLGEGDGSRGLLGRELGGGRREERAIIGIFHPDR